MARYKPVQRLILHIGAPKAGSTSLQAYLRAHRDTVAEVAGVHVPARGSLKATGAYAHHNLAYAVGDAERAAKFRPDAGTWAEVLAEIAASGRPAGLISSEALYDVPDAGVAEVARAVAGFDVRVVALLRRQDQYVESAYNQMARFGRVDGGIRAFYATWRHVFDFEARLAPWAAAFGDDRMVVIPFEPDRIAAGVTRTVLAACGVAVDGLPGDDLHVNVRVGARALHAVDHVLARCRAALGPAFRLPAKDVIRLVTRAQREDPRTAFTHLDHAGALSIWEASREGNRRVAARYGVAGAPELFAAPPAPEEYARRPEAYAPEPEQLAFLDAFADAVVQSAREAGPPAPAAPAGGGPYPATSQSSPTMSVSSPRNESASTSSSPGSSPQ